MNQTIEYNPRTTTLDTLQELDFIAGHDLWELWNQAEALVLKYHAGEAVCSDEDAENAEELIEELRDLDRAICSLAKGAGGLRAAELVADDWIEQVAKDEAYAADVDFDRWPYYLIDWREAAEEIFGGSVRIGGYHGRVYRIREETP
jgi:hypothetical protein